MTFGEKLQKLRAREGLSQDALAELLDVSRQAVSKWERDETMPETEKVVRISNSFHVTTDYLLKDEPEQPEERQRRREFGEWFRDRGWLLGWIPCAWGAYCMARMWRLLAFQDSWWMRGWMLLMYPAPYGNAALAGLGTVLLCRRRAGQLCWYHAGMFPVLWGILEFLRVGLLMLMMRMAPENVAFGGDETVWSQYGGLLLFAAVVLTVGLALIFLGKQAAQRKK